MKKSLIFVCMLTISLVAWAGNDKHITVQQLPQNALIFIQKHFPGVEVSYAKMERDFLDRSYEVIFVDGSKVEFDKKGEWKEIDCKYSFIPQTAIPQKMNEYLTKHHPGKRVVGMDRDRRDYELKLDNGMELIFDKNQNFLRMD